MKIGHALEALTAMKPPAPPEQGTEMTINNYIFIGLLLLAAIGFASHRWSWSPW